MNYRITITREEPNPEHAEQMKKMEENRGRAGSMRMYDEEQHGPSKNITVGVLITEITEEQFQKVQAEIIKAFQ